MIEVAQNIAAILYPEDHTSWHVERPSGYLGGCLSRPHLGNTRSRVVFNPFAASLPRGHGS